MKKIRVYILFTLLIMLAFITNVSAEEKCTYSKRTDLNKLAWNMNFNYEPVEKKVEDYNQVGNEDNYTMHYSYDLSIYNLTSNLYIKVTNDFNEEVATFTAADIVDGKIIYNVKYTGEIVTYTFAVYVESGDCEGELLRSVKLTTPLRNEYAEMLICGDIPDFYLCQPYLTSTVDYSTFFAKAEAYKQKQELVQEEEEEKKSEKKKNVKYILLGVGSVIVVGGLVTFIVIKKKRGKVF